MGRQGGKEGGGLRGGSQRLHTGEAHGHMRGYTCDEDPYTPLLLLLPPSSPLPSLYLGEGVRGGREYRRRDRRSDDDVPPRREHLITAHHTQLA